MSILKTKIIRPTTDITNISEYYNEEFLKQPRYDIYGFLNTLDVLYTNTVSEIEKVFEKNIEMIGVVYFDKYLSKNINNIHYKGDNLILQLYPPFEANTNIIYNPTIFVNGHINQPIFDPNLNHLRNYDVIQKLSKVSKIIHIPKILLISEYSHSNIKEELELYVRQSRS